MNSGKSANNQPKPAQPRRHRRRGTLEIFIACVLTLAALTYLSFAIFDGNNQRADKSASQNPAAER